MPWLRMATLLAYAVFSSSVLHSSELEDRFLLAVRTGDVVGVKAALANGVNVNTKFRYDRMALSFAADRGNPEVVKVLLEAGADVGARDTFYQMDAMSQAVSKKHIPIIRMLLDKGAPNSEGVLMMAVQENSLELAKVSLEKGGLRPDSLSVALVRAMKDNRGDLVALLQKAGANPPFAVEPALLDQYSGTYKAEGGQDLVFRRRGDTLEAGPAGQTFGLLPLAADRFRPEDFEGISVKFESEGNRVVSVTVLQGSNETRYKKQEGTP